MDIKEAIKILHPDTTAEAIAEIEYYGGFKGKARAMKAVNEACIVACEALEKQIPKKVNEIYKAEHIEDIEAYGENALFGYCPMCGELQCSIWDANTCGDCGQALDWKVEE